MVTIEQNSSGGPRADEVSVSEISLLGSFVIVARHHGLSLTVPQLVRDHRVKPDRVPVATLLYIANISGLRGSRTRLTWRDLLSLGKALPAIVLLRNGTAMVLREVTYERQAIPCIVLQDPNAAENALLTLDEVRFNAAWSGDVLLFKRDYPLHDEDQPFGIWLIIGQMLRDRRIARDICISAFMLSLLAIAPIMFWRLLTDRVLHSGNLSTFAVLCVAMLVLIAFETAFGFLRRHLVLHVAQRIDVKLTTYIFNKVLQLPIEFFEINSVGVITRDMNEIHKIRQFLSHGLLSTALDSFVLFVFLPIMLLFSPLLTLCVLGFALLMCGWIIVRLPELRKKAGAVFAVEGEKGAFLVETLHGARTVKAMALDARRRHGWDGKVAKAARLRFDEGRTANVVQTAIVPLAALQTTRVKVGRSNFRLPSR